MADIEGEARWSGEVRLAGDVVVPEGARLRLAPGTVVRGGAGETYSAERSAFGTRGPLGRRGLAQLFVYGILEGEGARFESAGWGGVFLLGRARARLDGCRLGASGGSGLCGLDFSAASARGCGFESEGFGAAFGGFATARLRGCRLSGGSAGLRVGDDAEVKASGCRLDGGALAGRATLWWLGGAVRGAGMRAEGDARLRSARGLWESAGVALSARERSSADLRGDVFRHNPCGVELLGRARAALRGLRAEGNETALSARDEARAAVSGGRWEGNGVALKASQEARVSCRGGHFVGQSTAAGFVEDAARLELSGGLFAGNENGVLALHASRLDARGCRFEATRDTALWLDHRCRARVRGGEHRGNRLDTHVETQPSYGG